jgi:hypothetical protein
VASCGDCRGCLWAAGGFKLLTKGGTVRPVVNCAADLRHQVGASPRPAHLLGLARAAIEKEICRSLGDCSPDAQAATVSSGVVDKPGALDREIVVDFMTRMRQLALCNTFWASPSYSVPVAHQPPYASPPPPCTRLETGGVEPPRRQSAGEVNEQYPGAMDCKPVVKDWTFPDYGR